MPKKNNGTAADDAINGSWWDDAIYGMDGDDTLFGDGDASADFQIKCVGTIAFTANDFLL